MLKWFYNATGKRERPYNRWEPIYIGTNEVQPYHTIPSKYEDLHFMTLYVRSQLMMRGSLGRGALTRWSRFGKCFLKQSGEKTIYQPIW